MGIESCTCGSDARVTVKREALGLGYHHSIKPGIVHPCYPSTKEEKAEESEVQTHPYLHNEWNT